MPPSIHICPRPPGEVGAWRVQKLTLGCTGRGLRAVFGPACVLLGSPRPRPAVTTPAYPLPCLRACSPSGVPLHQAPRRPPPTARHLSLQHRTRHTEGACSLQEPQERPRRPRCAHPENAASPSPTRARTKPGGRRGRPSQWEDGRLAAALRPASGLVPALPPPSDARSPGHLRLARSRAVSLPPSPARSLPSPSLQHSPTAAPAAARACPASAAPAAASTMASTVSGRRSSRGLLQTVAGPSQGHCPASPPAGTRGELRFPISDPRTARTQGAAGPKRQERLGAPLGLQRRPARRRPGRGAPGQRRGWGLGRQGALPLRAPRCQA